MMPGDWPRRVTIVGIGLMGGSLGLAIRRQRPDATIVGVDRDPTALDRARERGAIHEGQCALEEGVAGAELVVLATPVSAILAYLERLPGLIDDCVVTDVGSTKRAICRRGRETLGERFIGGHPLTGSERSGIDAARGDIFQNAVWVLATPPDPPPRSLPQFLETLGARVIEMTPHRHDRVVAATSHLPQLLSMALGARLADFADEDGTVPALISSSGADWLRLARSSPTLWRDVVATNADRIHEEIQTLIAELRGLDGDLDRLERAFRRANALQVPLGTPYPRGITTEVSPHGERAQRAVD